MKKILIIGSPGTGKSTVARQLAQKTGLPVIHLDQYWHDHRMWDKNLLKKKEQWRQHVQKLTAQRTWIMDGNFTSTLDIRIPESDFVIFLDYPRRIALFRTLKRRVKYHNIQRPDMPETWQETLSLDLLQKVWNFKKFHKPRIENLLSDKLEDQYIVLKTPVELQTYLKNVPDR